MRRCCAASHTRCSAPRPRAACGEPEPDFAGRRRPAGPLLRSTALGDILAAHDVILDGEIVALDASGCAQFYPLLYRRAEPFYYAFGPATAGWPGPAWQPPGGAQGYPAWPGTAPAIPVAVRGPRGRDRRGAIPGGLRPGPRRDRGQARTARTTRRRPRGSRSRTPTTRRRSAGASDSKRWGGASPSASISSTGQLVSGVPVLRVFIEFAKYI